jgi:fructose/tagatose bisphosphate aldolase
LGVTKINIDTDAAWCGPACHGNLQRNTENFDLPVGKVFMTEYAKFIAEKNVNSAAPVSWKPCAKLVSKVSFTTILHMKPSQN